MIPYSSILYDNYVGLGLSDVLQLLSISRCSQGHSVLARGVNIQPKPLVRCHPLQLHQRFLLMDLHKDQHPLADLLCIIGAATQLSTTALVGNYAGTSDKCVIAYTNDFTQLNTSAPLVVWICIIASYLQLRYSACMPVKMT